MTKTDDRARYTFRLPGELLDRLKREAAKKGYSVNALILHILEDWAKGR